METLGERVKRLRGERVMTAAQLGRAAGIGENAVFKIESGATKAPSFTVGLEIARALGVSPYDLAGLRVTPPASAPALDDVAESHQPNPGDVALLEALHRLTDQMERIDDRLAVTEHALVSAGLLPNRREATG